MPTNEFQIKNTIVTQFDSIRFLFAMFVIVVHHQFAYINVPSAFAYMAMHTFFIMSAFLIARGLLLNKPNSKSFWHFYKEFYIKRILRIFPVYFAYLGFVILLGLLFYFMGFKDILGVVREMKKFGWMLLTFTYNYREVVMYIENTPKPDFILFSHLWSLSLEEQFYVAIPFLVFFMNRKNIKRMAIFFIFFFPIFRIWYYQNVLMAEPIVNDADYILRGLIYYRASFLQSDCFFYGILLVTYDFKKYIYLYKWIFYLLAVVYLLSIIVNGLMVSQQMNISFFSAITRYDFMILNKQYLYHDLLVNLLIFFMFLNCLYNPNFLAFMNNKKILDFGNKYTYSSYVYQYIFILPFVGVLYPILNKKLQIPDFIAQFIILSMSILGIYFLSKISYEKMEIKFLYLLKNKKNAKKS